ncbi:MAG TPA: prenyltransferase/squalene oxidase repeat-containing protein, partial [Pirellulales bacterium]|nr:prenyltransferase/squalene oxidase repeat-containing protein [Pirellulales bacterium]
RVAWFCAVLSVLLPAAAASAADDSSSAQHDREQAITKGIDYLRTKGQAADGSYSAASDPIGITALVTAAILRNGRSAQDPLVAKSLKYLETFVQPDGGIYRPDSGNKNYETCLAVFCFSAANADGHYSELLKQADKYVKSLQWDESEDQKPSDVNYGGAGYGRSKRPDLSNTAFLVDALKAAGNGPDDEAMKKALIFVSRCQNLESEHNTTEFAAKINDGGCYYTPAGGGGDPAGKTPEGGLRSYASMTYAGLKSMIYAGLKPDDPRVKAATDWIRQHYDLESNPGMGDSGLYYYYDTYAKALNALGQETFVDAAGHEHHWRAELTEALVKRQQPDGSWTNSNSRWLEGDPNLVTGYALLALSFCQKK